MTEAVPERLWSPPPELRERSEMAALARDVGAADYDALWRWSVADVARFWRTLWDRYAIRADGGPARVLASDAMPGARWFPDVRLSYPEHLLAHGDDDAVAIHAASELREDAEVTWGELREQVRRIRAGLRAMGVGHGDRVAACLPNVPETVAAFLAVSSLGAIWSCCSPDFGARTVVDRFAQIEPTVLLAVDGYRYGGRDFDRSALIDEIAAALPSVRDRVTLGYLDPARDTWADAFPPTDEPLAFARVPFDHPLWILYSSGTTGTPKAIVHGHGGPLLEAIKSWRLHHAVEPGDRALWFTTTGWMMWNYLVGALLAPGVRIVLYDGSPGHPDMGVLWDLVARSRATLFGTGAAYLHGCMHAGIEPGEGRDLSALRAMGSTGSPLSPAGFRWVRDHVGEDVWLASVSGGTDVVTAFVCGAPLMPVHVGELPARALGAAVEAWDDDGRPVIDEVGELVLTRPMPSMPVGFWGDDDGSRYRDAYFAHYPGVWRQGDWITITPRGSAVIHGRSDATINRAGIRIGTAEIYNAVLGVPGIADALAVDVPDADGAGDGWLGLFVVLDSGVALDDALTAEVRRRIRSDCSPRHVPDELIAAPAVPRTLTGKALEVPVKRMLMGHDPERVANVDALADPDAFAWFAAFARERVAGCTDPQAGSRRSSYARSMAERDDDLRWLRRAIELSAEARERGNPPFGTLLVGPDGAVLAEERNTERTDDDISAHPEFKLAVWAGRELDAETAAGTTMYTSCENCAMCTAALIRAGIGRVVYAMSAERLGAIRGVRATDLKLPLREVVSRAAHEVDVVGPLIEDESAAIQDGFWD